MTQSDEPATPPPLSPQLLAPSRIILVGASGHPGSVGHSIWENLLVSGRQVELHAIGPHRVRAPDSHWHETIDGLPTGEGLAIVALPARLVPDAIRGLGEKGIAIAIVVTAGLGGQTETGRAMLQLAQSTGVRIIGPNCLGLLLPNLGINASFAASTPPPGNLALLSQSGAIATAMIEWSAERRVGFSAMLSVGDMAQTGLVELLRHLGEDDTTDVILLYVEGLKNGPGFLAAAREVGRRKPVVVLKAGRSAAAGKAAMSHTGALAGSWDAYRTAFTEAGVVVVDSLEDLCLAATALRFTGRPAGKRLAILTNGGGAGILAVDALDQTLGQVAELSSAALEALDAVLPSIWSNSNPVDIIGDADAERYRAALDALLDDDACDAVLVINCPTGLLAPADGAAAIAASVRDARQRGCKKAVLGCWIGPANFRTAAPVLAAEGIACFADPGGAVRAFDLLLQRERMEAAWPRPAVTPAPAPQAVRFGRELVESARREGRTLLTEIEAKDLLSYFGIPIVPTRLARNVQDVAKTCAGLAPPYAVKIASRDISHKSDVGGVALNLADAKAAQDAASGMELRVRDKRPEARIDGFAVQTMVERGSGIEVFAGLSIDPTFGPLIMFGEGGKAIEVIGDKALVFPPIDRDKARACVASTRIARLLAGYRDVPPSDIEALAFVLQCLSQIADQIPGIAEIDINPLLAQPNGTLALDARVVMSP